MSNPRTPRRLQWWALVAVAGVALACSSPGASDSGSDATGNGDGAAEDTAAGDYFAETYPAFEAAEHSGDGDGVVDLPEGVAQALVTATYDGSGNFSVAALDEGNESTGELLVNTIGAYSGTTAVGLLSIGNDPVKLAVTADAAWTITLAPIAEAPALAESGEGDGVFKYEGDAATWAVTHDGEANFTLSYYTSADFEMPLLVNEIGAYEGDVPATAGPGLVVITADGAWTIAAK
jgi:hypothetical protein